MLGSFLASNSKEQRTLATATPSSANSSASQAQQAVQQNMAIRNMITGSAVDLTQQIFTTTITNYTPGQAYPINVKVNTVGLVKRFWVKITGTIADGSGATGANLTPLGPCNVLSQILLTDTSNQVRVQTTGWHLHMLATARRNTVFGAAYSTTDPCGIGANLGINKAVNIPPGGTDGGVFNFFYEVPVSYSDSDLTGSMWMNVVNASANLQLTINPVFFASGNATDTVNSVYQMAAGNANLGSITSMTITVYQNCLDQLPTNNGQVMLPSLDLQYALLVLNTNSSGFTANLDQAIPYANYRQFMSTFVIYDNGGALNPGTDLNYIAMQSANSTYFFKVDPYTLSLLTRNLIGDDFPAGVYYISTRNQPVNTLQYGNRQLVLNPNAVNANSSFQIGYEAIAPLGIMNNAGSIFQS